MRPPRRLPLSADPFSVFEFAHPRGTGGACAGQSPLFRSRSAVVQSPSRDRFGSAHGAVSQARGARTGHVRQSVQGARLGDQPDRGAEEDHIVQRRRGRAGHDAARGEHLAGAVGFAARRATHRRGAHGDPRRTAAAEPRAGPGVAAARGQTLLLPAAARSALLPCARRHAPRPETAEFAGDRQQPHHQTGRLWSRSIVLHPGGQVHPRGGHAVVSRARDTAGHSVLLHPGGYLERRVHYVGDDQRSPGVLRRERDRAAVRHLSGAGHAHRRELAECGGLARLARVSAVAPARLASTAARPGRRRLHAARVHAATRSRQAHHRRRCPATSVL
eukprot:ctg_3193.g550